MTRRSWRIGMKRIGLVFGAATVVIACALMVSRTTGADHRALSIGALSRVFATSTLAAAQDSRSPAENIVGPSECVGCHNHEAEGRAWAKSRHYTSLDAWDEEPTKYEAADQIIEKLDLDDMQESTLCIGCHFTAKLDGDEPEVIAGVSCESCHGPAEKWVTIHNDFGRGVESAKTESSQHREARLAKCGKAGMIRPFDLYSLANNCLACHSVTQEDLVNRGGHPTSSDFELVSWSQGEVRHNYASSKGQVNEEAPAARKRVMYVVGRAVDLEWTLRASLAITAEDGKFAKAVKLRYAQATRKLQAIHKAKTIQNVAAILEAVRDGKLLLTPSNKNQISKAIEQVSKLTQEIANKYDGSKLAAIDSLIPQSNAYRGKVTP